MGCDQGGKTVLSYKVLQQLKYLFRGIRIEITGRFVREQDFRIVGQGAGNGNPLLFAAGQFGRAMLVTFRKADRVEQCRCFFFRGTYFR